MNGKASGAARASPDARETLLHAVEQVIDTQIRPFLGMHGGGVELIEVKDDGTVRLEFNGSCRGCALKGATYALGVRQKLLPLDGVREVLMNDVRLSDTALKRMEHFYGGHNSWIGWQANPDQ